jgi:hypothetical protein
MHEVRETQIVKAEMIKAEISDREIGDRRQRQWSRERREAKERLIDTEIVWRQRHGTESKLTEKPDRFIMKHGDMEQR